MSIVRVADGDADGATACGGRSASVEGASIPSLPENDVSEPVHRTAEPRAEFRFDEFAPPVAIFGRIVQIAGHRLHEFVRRDDDLAVAARE